MTTQRFISDGDTLYEVVDMPKLLAEPKDILTSIYIFTKYNYQFQCIVRDMLKSGMFEYETPIEDTYPYEAMDQTIKDFDASGVFTKEELDAMWAEVRKLILNQEKLTDEPSDQGRPPSECAVPEGDGICEHISGQP